MSFQQSESQVFYSRFCQKQAGIVIVVALFIVALVASMAYVMMARLERDTRRTQLIVRNTEAEFLAQGSIAWAEETLRNNWEQRVSNRPVDKMPITSPVMMENGYRIVSSINDMQARFNVNNVTDREKQADFVRLMQAVVPGLSLVQAQQIAVAVTDWTQPGSSQQQSLARYYQYLSVPYRVPHRPMFDVSELRLVKGVTASLYRQLQPFVIALPPPTLLNVQTMLAEVMVTLAPSMTLATVKAIDHTRRILPLASVDAFLNSDVIKNHHGIDKKKLTAVSEYFLVKTEVVIEKQQTVIYTLMMRVIKDQKPVIHILWQSKGSW